MVTERAWAARSAVQVRSIGAHSASAHHTLHQTRCSTKEMAVKAENDLTELLSGLSPRLNPGLWVYVQVASLPTGAHPVVTVREDEGLTLVVAQHEADHLGLDYDFLAAWITLEVHSALEAVGLTAAVSAALTGAGISANVVAGHTHDHLFVPHDRASEAMVALGRLTTSPS